MTDRPPQKANPMSTTTLSTPNPHAGRGMLALVFLLLGGSVALCVILYVAANRDPSFAVERDYYAKAVSWDEQAAAAAASDALGWRAEIEPHRLSAREVRFSIRLRDAGGALVEGARVHLEAFPNARAAATQEVDLAEDGGEYSGDFKLTHLGLWELRLRATHGDQTWIHTERLELTP